VSVVRTANQQIVAAYDSLGLTNNDPNTVGEQAAATIGRAFALYSEEFFASVVANLAKQFGIDVASAIHALTDAFGMALDAAAQAINNVGYTFASWIEGLGNILNEALDFSCVVEISNLGGSYELVRIDYGVVYGDFAVLPPERIAPGGVGRFWLKDPKPSIHGADGWATYSYVDASGAPQLARFTFDDPTGFAANTVTVSSPTFGFYTKSGDVASHWSAINKQTTGGHPLFATFVWGSAPIPPDA
jgi:hypothetical protein